MRDHRALGAARRAGRIEQRGQILRRSPDGRMPVGLLEREIEDRARAIGLQRLDAFDELGHRQRGQCRFGRGCDDQHGRFCVTDEILDFRRRIGRIERVIDCADLQYRQIDAHTADRFFRLHHNPVTRFHAQCHERVRKPPRDRAHLIVAQLESVGLHESRTLASGFHCRI